MLSFQAVYSSRETKTVPLLILVHTGTFQKVLWHSRLGCGLACWGREGALVSRPGIERLSRESTRILMATCFNIRGDSR